MDHGSGHGFAWARFGNKVIYSCYCTPNCSLQAFDLYLVDLESSIKDQAAAGMDVIVAGDLNSYSAE